MDLYRHLYDEEWVRRDSLQTAVATPIGLLTVVGGALSYLALEFGSGDTAIALVFWTAFSLAMILFSMSTFHVFRSFIGHTYQRIPLPSQIQAYHSELTEYYQAIDQSEKTDAAFCSFLQDAFVEATDKNSVNNIERSESLYEANLLAVIALLLTGVAAVPYLVAQRTQEPFAQEVQMTDDAASPASRATSSTDDAVRPAEATPETAPAIPPPPRRPRNINFRSNLQIFETKTDNDSED